MIGEFSLNVLKAWLNSHGPRKQVPRDENFRGSQATGPLLSTRERVCAGIYVGKRTKDYYLKRGSLEKPGY